MRSDIAVVGADGVVGSTLAAAVGGYRVLHGSPRGAPREVMIRDAQEPIRSSGVVFNSQGLRQMGGLSAAQFRQSHVDSTRSLVEAMSPGATLVHISSASVLGLPSGRGPHRPAPAAFPMPDYATVKLEAEQLAIAEGVRRGLAVVVLRLTVVNTDPLDGMLKTLVTQARRGVLLDLRPHASVHHFCSGALLGEVAKQVASRNWPVGAAQIFTVGDPFVVSNAELAHDVSRRWRTWLRVPLWAGSTAWALRRGSSVLRTRRGAAAARVLGVIGMNVAYDVDATYEALGLDRAAFSKTATFDRVLDAEATRG